MNVLGYFSLFLLSIVTPTGKLLIKKSIEYDSEPKKKALNYMGIFLLVVVGPATTTGSYFYADNAIVAPVAASGVLVSFLLARVFLEEGKNMDNSTILGIISFVSGLFLILFSYSELVGNKVDDENIEWGVLSLCFGIWMLSVTILTNTSNIFRNNNKIQLITWSISAGLFGGSDIIASMDKWIYNHQMENSEELLKAGIATAFYVTSCALHIFVLNKLLTDQDNAMHVVATIVSTVQLLCDVLADCFVFERYKLWDQNNYAMSVIGLALMIIGINILQTSTDKKTPYEKVPKEEPGLDFLKKTPSLYPVNP